MHIFEWLQVLHKPEVTGKTTKDPKTITNGEIIDQNVPQISKKKKSKFCLNQCKIKASVPKVLI